MTGGPSAAVTREEGLAIRVVDDSVVVVAHLSGESVNNPTDPEATYWTAFLGYIARGCGIRGRLCR